MNIIVIIFWHSLWGENMIEESESVWYIEGEFELRINLV